MYLLYGPGSVLGTGHPEMNDSGPELKKFTVQGERLTKQKGNGDKLQRTLEGTVHSKRRDEGPWRLSQRNHIISTKTSLYQKNPP